MVRKVTVKINYALISHFYHLRSNSRLRMKRKAFDLFFNGRYEKE